MVFQNPEDQIVSTIIEEDCAFGPENLGIPTKEIQQRVAQSLKTVEMYDQRLRPPAPALSRANAACGTGWRAGDAAQLRHLR